MEKDVQEPKLVTFPKVLRGAFEYVLWCVSWQAVAMVTRFCNTVLPTFAKKE